MQFNSNKYGHFLLGNNFDIGKISLFSKVAFLWGAHAPFIVKIILPIEKSNDIYCVIVDAYFRVKKGLCVIAKLAFF